MADGKSCCRLRAKQTRARQSPQALPTSRAHRNRSTSSPHIYQISFVPAIMHHLLLLHGQSGVVQAQALNRSDRDSARLRCRFCRPLPLTWRFIFDKPEVKSSSDRPVRSRRAHRDHAQPDHSRRKAICEVRLKYYRSPQPSRRHRPRATPLLLLATERH